MKFPIIIKARQTGRSSLMKAYMSWFNHPNSSHRSYRRKKSIIKIFNI